MLLLPDGRRVSPYVLTSLVECDRAIRRYQLAQTDFNRLQVRYLAPDSCHANEARLAEGLSALLDGQMQVELARVSVIPRTLRGKQQVFIREFDSVQLTEDQANDR